MIHHRLHGNRCYLSGAMDRVADGGVGWRKRITPLLHAMDVIVFDPTCKPVQNPVGDETDRDLRKLWVKEGKWDELSMFMKEVRGYDLRMVNISDFIIASIDMDVHTCGSYEEIAIANHEKKPILVWCQQGKANAPWWLFGMIPHQHIFSSLEELMSYLEHIDRDENIHTYKRWFFFNI